MKENEKKYVYKVNMNVDFLQKIKSVEIPKHFASRILLNIQSNRYEKISAVYIRRVAAIFILFLVADISTIVYYHQKHKENENDSNSYIEIDKNQIYNE